MSRGISATLFTLVSMAAKLKGMNILDKKRLMTEFYDSYHDQGYITYGPNNHHLLRSQLRSNQRYPPLVGISFLSDILLRRVYTRVRLHVLYYFLHFDQIGELSHKCGKSTCLNIYHLTIEDHKTNCNRKLCVSNNECSGHHDDDESNACILPPSLVWYVVIILHNKEIARDRT